MNACLSLSPSINLPLSLPLSLSSQLESVSGGKVNQTPRDTRSISLPPHLRHHGNQTEFVTRLEVYVILRDLDLYLTKTARDLLLLAARHRGSPLGRHALQ